MKCPNDQTEMEKGSLMVNGTTWAKPNWLTKGIQIFGEKVIAWKCTKCGKVELYAEQK